MSYALVLGGGGTVGVSWTVGALSALSDATGIDLNQARVLIGTSAGSLVAAAIGGGSSLRDLVDIERNAAPPADGGGGWATSFDTDLVAEIFQLWMGAGKMTTEVAREMGARTTRASRKSGEEWVDVFVERLGAVTWPEADLRITATSCATGERRVFTASDGVDLVRVVAASCAVPGILPPVDLDGAPYMDGGVWSLTNADAILDTGVEAALVVAPQAGGGLLAPPAIKSLERDRRLLEEKGVRPHVLVPAEGFEALAANLMDAALRAPAVELGLTHGAEWAKRLADEGFSQ